MFHFISAAIGSFMWSMYSYIFCLGWWWRDGRSVNGWMMDGWSEKRPIYGWMEGRNIDGWMDGWMASWKGINNVHDYYKKSIPFVLDQHRRHISKTHEPAAHLSCSIVSGRVLQGRGRAHPVQAVSRSLPCLLLTDITPGQPSPTGSVRTAQSECPTPITPGRIRYHIHDGFFSLFAV